MRLTYLTLFSMWKRFQTDLIKDTMEKLGVTHRAFISINVFPVLFSAFILCSSCSSIKPTTTKSGKHYFETFYAGADGTQYFIKPLSFIDSETKEELLVDIAFRYKDQVKDSAIVNFSIKSPSLYKAVNSLSITTTAVHVAARDIRLLYHEKSKDGFISRFTTKIPLREVQQMFDSAAWTFTVHYPTQATAYRPSKKTVKAIATLSQKVFILM